MVQAKAAEKDSSQHKGSQASVAALKPRDESAWSMTSSQRRTQTELPGEPARGPSVGWGLHRPTGLLSSTTEHLG